MTCPEIHIAERVAAQQRASILTLNYPALIPKAILTGHAILIAEDYRANDLPRRDTALFSMIKEDVEIAWSVAEQSQQQRNLSPMMDPMIGCVMHQLSQWH